MRGAADLLCAAATAAASVHVEAADVSRCVSALSEPATAGEDMQAERARDGPRRLGLEERSDELSISVLTLLGPSSSGCSCGCCGCSAIAARAAWDARAIAIPRAIAIFKRLRKRLRERDGGGGRG